MAAPKIHVVRTQTDTHPEQSTAPVERYNHGWRAGKPVEDPEKLKRWGYVGAKPSEYLVCTHRGQVDRKRSGQGMRIFKWPWLAVSIVPTTLQRIEFTADQVTRERVGVSMTANAARRNAELERDRVIHQIQIAEEEQRAKAAADVAALDAERARLEAFHAQSTLELAQHRALELAKQAADHEVARNQAELSLELRYRDAEQKEHENQLAFAHQRRMAEIEQMLAQGRAAHELVTHGLPQIAEALSQTFGTVNYTQIGGDAKAGPLGAVPAALAQLLAIARSFGVELPAPKPDTE